MKKLNNAVDTASMIRFCLKCPWPECWDCLGKKTEASAALRLKLKKEDEEKCQTMPSW